MVKKKIEAAVETVPAQFRLEHRHIAALREAALKRAGERGAGRLDASEVLREVLDDWMARRK